MQTSINSHNYDEIKKISLKDLSENGKEKLAGLSDDELQTLKLQAVEVEDYDIAKMIKREQIERKEKVPETEESTEEKKDDDAEYKAIQEEKNVSHAENLMKANNLIAQLNETDNEISNDEIVKKEKIGEITNKISKEVEVSSHQIENLQKKSEELFSDVDEITKEIKNMREDFHSWKWRYYWNHVIFSPERIKRLGYKIKNVVDEFDIWLKYFNELHGKIVDENKKLSQNMDLLYNNWEPLVWKKDLQFFANLRRIKEKQNQTLSSIEQWLHNKILDKQLNAPMLWEVFSWLWIMNGGVAQEIWLMLRNIYNNAKFKPNIQNIKYENDEIKGKIDDFWNLVFDKH